MSAQPQRLVAALDLGSTKVVAAIAEVTGDARDAGARILGVATEKTAGIRRGVVRDIEETTRAIDKAMKGAQRMAGVEVGSAYCGIAGEHVAGRSSHGMVSVTGDEIRTSDVARVNDMASNISFGRDHELLHAIPQDYLIDQQGGINEPIGMTGSRLEAEVYLVTVLSSVLQNLKKCVERAGFHVQEFVLEPLAASLAVAGRPVVATETVDTAYPFVPLVRGDGVVNGRLVTVDNADTMVGRIAVVLGLRDLLETPGHGGHYGVKPGATSLIPKP